MSPTLYLRRALYLLAALLLSTPLIHAQGREPVYNPQGELERLEETRRQGASEANMQSGEDIRGRDEWFMFQRRFPYDRIPADLYPNALRQTKAMEQQLRQLMRDKKGGGASPLAANRWENVGPLNSSGRVRAIAIHPTDPNIMYIGAAAGGVWKTTNGGTNWNTTFDTVSSLAIGALAIDHSNPNIVYAGTGENTNNLGAYLGAGLFKSTDAGMTWKNIGLSAVRAFSKLHVHRQNSKILYAATAKSGGGFYRSEDGGATWTRTYTDDAIYDLSVNPANSNELYIGTDNSVRRSTDGGKTFTTVTSGMTLSRSLRISVALAPSQPSRVYALVARRAANGGNDIGELYVSTNSGTSWQLAKAFESFFFNEQGWYDNCLGVDYFDPNLVLAGGIDVYRSTDGGINWKNTTMGYFGGDVHVDQHVIEFHHANPGLVVLGNDGGVYSSVDGGADWDKISKAMATTQFYAIEVDQTRLYRLYGGTQDNGTWGAYGTSGFVGDWDKVLGGDGFFVVVDLTDPNIIYAENFNGTPLYRINANNLNSRVRIDGSISSDANTGDPGAWSTPIAMSPADKKTLYTGRSKLYRTTNRGTSWQTLNPGYSASMKITAIGLSHHDAKKMVVAAPGSGNNTDVRYSLDDGATWTKSTGVSGDRVATDIIYDPVVDGRVYLTLSGSGGNRVFRSDDNGATFQSIHSNLPNVPVNALAVDPRDNTHLFVGTDVGVFVSLDGGGYWMPFNDGLALSPVVDLKIHNTSHTLLAATHGRSIFRVNITGIQVQPIVIAPIGGQVVNTPGPATIRWAGFTGPVRILISYDGGKTYHVLVESTDGSTDTVNLPIASSSSVRIKVEELGGGRSAESSEFELKTQSNGTEQNKRAFDAEVIEYRKGYLWATVRGTDSLYKLKLPLLTAKVGLVRSGIPGQVRDMAYDAGSDRFYVLTTAADYSSPRLYRMDTNGVAQGEIPLPEELNRAVGVAMNGEGIALMTPGANGEVFVISDAGALVRRSGVLQGANNSDRRSLVWDGLGYVQGVVQTDNAVLYPSRLEHITDNGALRLEQSSMVILPNVMRLDWVGLAFEPTESDVNKRVYWATDTSGAFFRFERGGLFTSSVGGGQIVTGYVSREVALGNITPNPVRGETQVNYSVRSRRNVTLSLYDASGLEVMPVFEGTVEPGEHSITLNATGLASGVYYLALSGGPGERDVRPVVVVK